MNGLQAIPTSPWDFPPLEPWGAPTTGGVRSLLALRLRGLLWLRSAARAMADKLSIDTATRTLAQFAENRGENTSIASAWGVERQASQMPPRPASQTRAGRAIAAVTLTPRLLAQRPFPARHARAGCIALI